MMSFIDAIYKQGGQVFEVGGAVRDELWGIPHKDKDLLVTKIPFPKLVEILKSQGKVLEVGKSFGVLKFRPRHQQVEYDIALPRTEKSTGQGHRDFEVDFDENIPLELDLKRRDFTINAIAREITTHKLIDPYGGQEDLKNKVLRQVFPECFVEDPLRLMRAVQFAARFELQIEEKTLSAMKREALQIKTVSPERIIEEISKLLKAKVPSQGFALMRETGILPHVFPELSALTNRSDKKQKSPNVFEHSLRTLDYARQGANLENSGHPELLLASLFYESGQAVLDKAEDFSKPEVRKQIQEISAKLTKNWLQRYRASMLGIEEKRVVQLVKFHRFEIKNLTTDAALRRFIYQIGKDVVDLWLDLEIADRQDASDAHELQEILRLKKSIEALLAQKPPLSLQELAIDGNGLMKAGYPEGPLLGKILHASLEEVLERPEKNTREALEAFISEHFPK